MCELSAWLSLRFQDIQVCSNHHEHNHQHEHSHNYHQHSECKHLCCHQNILRWVKMRKLLFTQLLELRQSGMLILSLWLPLRYQFQEMHNMWHWVHLRPQQIYLRLGCIHLHHHYHHHYHIHHCQILGLVPGPQCQVPILRWNQLRGLLSAPVLEPSSQQVRVLPLGPKLRCGA